MMYRPGVLAAALAVTAALTTQAARATPLNIVLNAVLTGGAPPDTAAQLSLTLDTTPSDALTITGPADQARLTWFGAATVTVPAYVADGSAAPGSVTYDATAADGRYGLVMTYRYFRRSPNGWQTSLLFTLAGSSTTPLFGVDGSVDPGFFAGFSGAGSITGASFGLSATVPASFVQTSTALRFAVGVPEPPAAALLAVALFALAPFRRRRCVATTGGSPRR